MKKVFLSFIIITSFIGCKTKKSAATTAGPSESEKQLSAVQSRFPDATKEELEKGKAVYLGPCMNCHGQKSLLAYDETRLTKIIDNMSAKAKISDTEKQALFRYAIGLRATSN